MKNIIRILLLTAGVIVAAIAVAQAQNKIDDERMERDIEVAENVLETLIKQQFSKNNFFPMEVEGTYMEGYGVTFRLPMDYQGQMIFMMTDEPKVVGSSGTGFSYSKSYSYSNSDPSAPKAVITEDIIGDDACENCPPRVKVRTKVPKNFKVRGDDNDSLHAAYTKKIVEASKNFLADYGDMISQLTPEEKVTITNRTEGARNWIWKAEGGRIYLSLEVGKSDITLFKQGKLTRDQFMSKVKMVNSETSDELTPDLELLSSIFNRLYQVDLSKTYFIEEGIYYERLKDYGVIFSMHVYSSTEADFKRANLPTLGLQNIDMEERDVKVKEIYPAFEKTLETDILEYGRTVKSLEDHEVLMFKTKVTQCKGCGIPSTLEISVKGAVLKDYNSGKINLETALSKVMVKKGPIQ